MLPSTNVASRVPWISAVNESSSSTIPATPRVVEVPEAMATPTSATRSARTSFAPSPTIATKCPWAFSDSTISAF